MAGSIQILHVEDDVGFAELTDAALGQADERFELVHEADVDGGIDRLESNEFDCVVSDYDLPGRDGIDFLEVVRETSEGLPFILFTGKGSEEIASEAISAGVTDYLQKEGGIEQFELLANRIENAVEGYRSSRALRERNRTLRIYERIFNTMQEGACLYDEDGRFRVVNDYLLSFYGTSREELVGTSSPLIEEVRQSGEGDTDPYRELLEGRREEIRGETEGEFPRHGHAVLEYRLTPLRIDGDIEGVVGVARDVTERAERERALERERNRFEAAFATVPEPAVHVFFEKDKPIVQHVNEAFEETFGLEAGEAVDRSIDELIVPAGDLDEALDINRIVREAGTIQAEVERETADGVLPFLFTARAMPVDETGRHEGVATYVDLSEQHRREEELARRNERLNRFAGVLSHDLRGPLNVATGRLEMARGEHDSESLRAVDAALERMRVMIDDLLAMAREEDASRSAEPVDLAATARASWEECGTDAATLRTPIERRALADASRLRQVFDNLLRNAVEHGGDAVTVTIGELEDGHGFYVEDDGPGIPIGDRERVLRTGYTTSETGNGFGLGIVRRIAEAHGWEFAVAESDSGGARFEFTGVTFEG